MSQINFEKTNKFYISSEQYYNTIAHTYDSGKQKNLYYFSNLVNLYSSLIPPNSTITEIGSGTGDLITHLKPKEGFGLDISEAMVRIAKKKYGHLKNIHYERQDIFESQGFFNGEYIIMADVLEHIDCLPKFLLRISERTPAKSLVIISVLNPIWEWLMDIIENFGMKIPEGPHERLSKVATEKIFIQSGFKIKEVGYRLLIPKKIPFSNWINSKFYKSRILAPFGFTIYWVLTK